MLLDRLTSKKWQIWGNYSNDLSLTNWKMNEINLANYLRSYSLVSKTCFFSYRTFASKMFVLQTTSKSEENGYWIIIFENPFFIVNLLISVTPARKVLCYVVRSTSILPISKKLIKSYSAWGHFILWPSEELVNNLITKTNLKG